MARTRSSSADAERAHRELGGGALGDDVHRLTAVGDEAVDAHAVAEVDALRVDELEGLEAGGERARALPGGERGVGGRAVEAQLDPHRRERGVGEQIAVEGVEHHGRVDAGEGAGLGAA